MGNTKKGVNGGEREESSIGVEKSKAEKKENQKSEDWERKDRAVSGS